jgi:PAS domain-containing protein
MSQDQDDQSLLGRTTMHKNLLQTPENTTEAIARNLAAFAPKEKSGGLLSNVRIGRKFALVSAVFALPVAFLVFSVVTGQNVTVKIAQAELEGSQVVKSLNEARMALHRNAAIMGDRINGLPTENAMSEAATAAAVDAMIKSVTEAEGMQLNPAVVAEATFRSKDFSDTSAELNMEDLQETSLTADNSLATLMLEIGDRSGLILDPELTSYYLMDTVVLRLPTVAHDLAELDTVLQVMRSKPTASLEDRSKLLTLELKYEESEKALLNSIESAYRYDADGKIKEALDADFQAARKAMEATINRVHIAIDNLTTANGGTANLPDMHVERDAAFTTLEKLAASSTGELDRLLNVRIGNARLSMWTNLSVAAGFAGLAYLAAFLIGNGVAASLRNLGSVMASLAQGRHGVEVPGRDRGDEIGDMARALQVFKDHEIERGRLLASAPVQQKALADSESRIRSLVKNIPGVAVRTHGDADRNVEFISENIMVLSGYTADDFMGGGNRPLSSIIHAEDLAEYRRVLGEAISRRQPFVSEHRITTKFGATKFVLERGQAVFNNLGKVEYIDSHFVDRFEDASQPAAPAPAPVVAVAPAATAPAIAPAPAYTPAPVIAPAPAPIAAPAAATTDETPAAAPATPAVAAYSTLPRPAFGGNRS